MIKLLSHGWHGCSRSRMSLTAKVDVIIADCSLHFCNDKTKTCDKVLEESTIDTYHLLGWKELYYFLLALIRRQHGMGRCHTLVIPHKR